ncbi:MAG: twin-arginine translocation signal domain-containing protein [Planctomycetaceae bacterium]|nr:twin-arginine translocation signal domain-containing protein [Planctomycetaceae bacterium]
MKTNRRNFIKQTSAACAAACIPSMLNSNAIAATGDKSSSKIWACWLHLSFNFAGGINNPRWGNGMRTEFEPEQSVWDAAVKKMGEQKINMVVINLDDSVLWRSHPEIALKNSWTPEKLREELAKMRKLGIEPIPCLNFSATHDAWMGEYAKMVSTKPYYQFCKDLIAEAIDIFDKPRFIHLGMDEETFGHQSHFNYIVIRQKEQWWDDLYFYFDQAMTRGVRPWIWSDYVWNNPDLFFKKMPKYAVQSNWYYREEFDLEKLTGAAKKYVQAYIDINAAGYDQIPTSSNDAVMYNPASNNNESISRTVEFCSKHIDDKHLLGFLQSMWMPTIEKFRPNIIETIELTGEARRNFEAKIKQ